MTIDHAYWALLIVSLGLLLSQTMVADKRAVHLLFALFSGSIAMVATHHLSADSLGAYKHLVALGTCATCNGYWLVARALFRRHNPITVYHLLFASSVALLVVGSESLSFAEAQLQLGANSFASAHSAMANLLNLFSSCMLLLTVWEGLDGFKQASSRDKAQRLVFVGSFGGALLGCTLLAGYDAISPWLMIIAAFELLLVTQALILWRFHATSMAKLFNLPATASATPDITHTAPEPADCDIELIQSIKDSLHHDKLHLQANLKLVDFAQRLGVPEYRISRALRQYFNARNFNQCINELRIQHATQLLQDPAHNHWPMLTVGLESGFASAGPFTRAFKEFHGCTPLEYKKQYLEQSPCAPLG